ncbi:hypothetical protein TNCV_655591 [Trichonephila clavipes]|nr:hypothetical protein TNCV_655591 [Trichonephila clavipes]
MLDSGGLSSPASTYSVGESCGELVRQEEIEFRSELSDLLDDNNAANKTYESHILEGESSSYESNEETHCNRWTEVSLSVNLIQRIIVSGHLPVNFEQFSWYANFLPARPHKYDTYFTRTARRGSRFNPDHSLGVHTGYFSNIPKCIKAEFIAQLGMCSQSSVVSSSQR